VAPTVEELVKTSTLLTPPKPQTFQELATEIEQRHNTLEQRYAELKANVAGIPPYQRETGEVSISPLAQILVESEQFRNFAFSALQALDWVVRPIAVGFKTLLERRWTPNRVYYAALEAWRRGDFEAAAGFLQFLRVEVTGDNVLAITEVLRPTFDPNAKRPDLRRRWEWESPEHASTWLKKRIGDEARFKRQRLPELNPDLVDPKDAHADMRKVLDPDLREFMLREKVRSVLPDRQAQVVWLLAQGYTPEEIANIMQVGRSTVDWHKHQAVNNPEFRRAFGR
jgi:hypothetical protein